MRFVIYLDQGIFKLADLSEWSNLVNKYRFKGEKTAKTINMDLSLFDAVSAQSLTRHAQNLLRELYDGN